MSDIFSLADPPFPPLVYRGSNQISSNPLLPRVSQKQFTFSANTRTLYNMDTPFRTPLLLISAECTDKGIIGASSKHVCGKLCVVKWSVYFESMEKIIGADS